MGVNAHAARRRPSLGVYILVGECTAAVKAQLGHPPQGTLT
jgi:hypothetical protein